MSKKAQLLQFPAPKPETRAEVFNKLQVLVNLWPAAADLIEHTINDLLVRYYEEA